MFPAVCLQVVHEVGKNTLIPSPSIDDSKRLLPLNVVTMRKKRKYIVHHLIEYTPYDISLTDLLIDQHVLEVQVEESKCCRYSNSEGTYSLHGKIKAYIKGIVDASPSASCKGAITVKLGELICQEIRDASFMSALMKRKLDMNNSFIKQINDTKTVLCVVKRVIKTTDKTEIKCTDNKDGNIKLSEKATSTVDVDVGGASSSVSEIVIEPGITLAYKVWELEVDVDSGEIIPMMVPDDNGGFFTHETAQRKTRSQCSTETLPLAKKAREYQPMKETVQKKRRLQCSAETLPLAKKAREYPPMKETVQKKRRLQYSTGTLPLATKAREYPPMKETVQKKRRLQYSAGTLPLATKAREYPPMKDEVAAALKDLQDILQPLRNCTKADGQIKSSLLDLMICYGDVVAMSQILSKAENCKLNEDKATLDKQFINNDTVWSILEFAGVQTKKGRVLYKRKATPKLTAVAYMIDAILEIEIDDLDTIYHCDEPQLKTLSNIFESAVTSSMPISMDVDMSSVLTASVSSFLTDLDFTVSKDDKRIFPPKAKTCAAECIFCVLYCLSS